MKWCNCFSAFCWRGLWNWFHFHIVDDEENDNCWNISRTKKVLPKFHRYFPQNLIAVFKYIRNGLGSLRPKLNRINDWCNGVTFPTEMCWMYYGSGKSNGFESIEHFRSGSLYSQHLNAIRTIENFAQFKNHWNWTVQRAWRCMSHRVNMWIELWVPCFNLIYCTYNLPCSY